MLNKSNSKEQPRSNFYGWLEITNQCNLKCPYCYADSTFDSKSVLSLSEIKQILRDFKDIGTNTVMISGGEPCIHKNIKSILSYAHNIGQNVTLITNGTIITEDLAKLLSKYNINVQLSLDSVNRSVYKRSRGVDMLPVLLKKVNLLKKYNVPIFLAVTLTNITKDTLEDVVKFAIDNDIQNIHIGELVPAGRGTKDDLRLKTIFPIYKRLYEIQKENFLFISIDIVEYYLYPLIFNEKRYYYCNGASGDALEVSTKGDVSYCMNIQDPKFGPTFNLNNTSIKQIKDILAVSPHKGLNVDDITECKDCEYRYICSGGCRAIAFNSFGRRIDAKSPYCEDIKHFIDYIKADISSGKADDYITFVREQLPDRKDLISKYF